MTLYCTKKLAEKLPVKPKKCPFNPPLFEAWFANVTTVGRKTVVAAVCGATRFGFVLVNVKKEQWAEIPALLLDGIRRTLTAYGVKPEIIERYVPQDAPMEIWAAPQSKGTAQIAHVIKLVNNIRYPQDMKDGFFLPVTRAFNLDMMSTGNGSGDYTTPYKLMMEQLREWAGEEPVELPAYELDVTMDMERFVVRRVLTVPVYLTFAELHRTIQTVMNWQNYHMHEFVLPVEGEELHLVGTEEDAEELYGDRWKLDSEVRLEEYLHSGFRFVYNYDFGDGWEVVVNVRNYLPDYNRYLPTCTACEEPAPPEDVGGVDGFLEFLDAIRDASNPRHEEMKAWVSFHWDRNPHAEYLNWRLQNVL